MGRERIALLILLAACSRDDAKAGSKGSKNEAGGPALASKSFYRLTQPTQPACASGAACEARFTLTALGDYHVNDRYPFKLEVDPAPGIEVDGTGTFAVDSEKTGALTLKFRAAKPGTTHITGTFKLSVCTDENCEIETPTIAFDVTAT